MKTRLSIATMIVLGVLMSGTGAGLALSGSSQDGSASQSQYGVSPKQDQGGGPVLGTQEAGDTNPAEQAVATTSSESLPFTGLAAVPILLLGLGLLTFGLVVARKTRESTQA